MACSATPYGLSCTGYCLPRAHAQKSCLALVQTGGQPGVTSIPEKEYMIYAAHNKYEHIHIGSNEYIGVVMFLIVIILGIYWTLYAEQKVRYV